MKHVPRVLLIAVGCALAFGRTAAQETEETHEIHACKDANGNVIYQDDECTASTGKKTAAPRSVGPAQRKPAAKTPEPRASIAVKKVPPAIRSPLPQHQRTVDQRGNYRNYRFPTILDGAVRPGNGRFASPEQTWQTFLAAIRSGDRAAAVGCFTPSARTEFGPHAESFPLEELRETVSKFTRIEVEGDAGPFWSIRALRTNQRPRWIFFERTDQGEWKIAAI